MPEQNVFFWLQGLSPALWCIDVYSMGCTSSTGMAGLTGQIVLIIGFLPYYHHSCSYRVFRSCQDIIFGLGNHFWVLTPHQKGPWVFIAAWLNMISADQIKSCHFPPPWATSMWFIVNKLFWNTVLSEMWLRGFATTILMVIT